MITQDEKVAFIDGVLDVLEGEIPLALWEHSKYSAAVDVWRLRCTLGVIANWKEFEGDVPIEDTRLLIRVYCLGVVQGIGPVIAR